MTVADDLQIIRDGKPLAKIYVAATPPTDDPANVPGGVMYVPPGEAARELNYHLSKMSGGAELEVVSTDDPASVKGPGIVIGELAVKLGATPGKTSESREGFRLLTQDHLLLIGGESERGALLGTYELLRKLGCDWIMPGEIGEVIPQRATVTIPQLDESQAPAFVFRALWYHGDPVRTAEEQARFYLWQRRQKGGEWPSAARDTGSHAWEGVAIDAPQMLKDDPTMLALRRAPDGTMKRMGPQLESTHPKLIEYYVRKIRDTYEKHIEAGEWTKDTPAGFGIGPADGLDYSMSPESLAASSGRVDPIAGELDRTDLLVLLGNKILEQVHDEYPNAYVGFYSYSVHEDYPIRYKPHPNIVITFAPISFSRYHSLLDENSKTQPFYRGVVEKWGELSRAQGNILIYRGYNWNLAENMIPFSKVRIWGEELPFYQHQGIIGLQVEAARCWSPLGPSDYVFMRLAWNTSLKWRDVLHEYCVHAYGDSAAAPMEQYFLRVTDRQHSAGQEAGSYFAIHLIYDSAWVNESQSLLDAARDAAKTDAQKTRIDYIGYALEALRLYLDYHDATMQFDFPRAEAGYDAMIAYYDKTHAINSDLVSGFTPQYLQRFIADFASGSAKYSSPPYKVVAPLPDELKTQLDPLSAGDRMHWQSPAINDDDFIKTRTYSTTWDAQGLGAYRAGAVWYRHRFTLNKDLAGEPIGLFIGGVDDEARVYLNGKFLGSTGIAFSVPATFDLTGAVRVGEENFLAIEVVHNYGLNELGVGGIIRPCFLFTGPRIQPPAPEPPTTRRLLPGGAVEEAKP